MSAEKKNNGNGEAATEQPEPASQELVPAAPEPPLPAGSIQRGISSSVSRVSMDRLAAQAQLSMIETLDAADERQLRYHTLRLEKQAEFQENELKSFSEGRGQGLALVKILALATLLLVAMVTGALLYKDQFSAAETIIVSCMAFVAGLVGGSGIPGLIRTLGGFR